ncbi:hypothetical protein [Deinococcus sp.]|uniref:hypothetical protein n=1 Tax=Deinococcus sp. TaxID=47478 RepID=UPI003CC54427
MNDQIVEILSQAGLSPTPLGVLDHAGQFFALYDDQLVYQAPGQFSRVALPDVTRIHSDREGVLRVETSEKTAITASLIGYDPAQVRSFFQQVRDVTARAKEVPMAPKTALKTEPALSPVVIPPPAPASPAAAAPVATTAPSDPARTPAPEPAAPSGARSAGSSPPVITSPAASLPVNSLPLNSQPVNVQPTSASAAAPSTPTSSASIPVILPPAAAPEPTPRPEPLVISSMPPLQESPRKPTVVRIQTPDLPPVSTPPGSSASGTTGSEAGHASAPILMAPASHVMIRSISGRDLLLRRAEAVQGFSGTIRLLAIVLGLAALGLAYVQYQRSEALSAIWTLLTGGVGTVALLAFAEALRMLAALGSELGAEALPDERRDD